MSTAEKGGGAYFREDTVHYMYRCTCKLQDHTSGVRPYKITYLILIPTRPNFYMPASTNFIATANVRQRPLTKYYKHVLQLFGLGLSQ